MFMIVPHPKWENIDYASGLHVFSKYGHCSFSKIIGLHFKLLH
jgi:hypothetical protein